MFPEEEILISKCLIIFLFFSFKELLISAFHEAKSLFSFFVLLLAKDDAPKIEDRPEACQIISLISFPRAEIESP